MTDYALYIEPEVHHLRRNLPGAVRQRVKAAFDDLARDPRPPRSRSLDMTGLEVPPGIEMRCCAWGIR